MVSPAETIIGIFYYFLPSFIISIFVVIIGLIVYLFGKKRNNLLMDNMVDEFNRNCQDRISTIKLVEASSMGRTYEATLKEGLSLTNFRMHFTMVHRHLIISKIASYFSHRKDFFLIEGDPTSKIVKPYQLEVFPRSDKKGIKALSDMLFNLDPLTVGRFNLDKIFIFRVNDIELFQRAFQSERKIAATMYSIKDNIVRFSYYPPESPSIRLVAELNEQLNPKSMMNLIFDLTDEIAILGKKGYFSGRKKRLRIARDKKLDEERAKKFKIY